MDQKKVLEKLLKIAENQQKIITKLAQALPPDSLPTSQVSMTPGHSAPASEPAPPADLKPRPVQKADLMSLVVGAAPALAAALASVAYGGPGVINVSFKPGQDTDANWNGVMKAIQSLEAANKIQAGHKVRQV